MLNSSQHLSALHWEVLGVLRGPNYHITAELCSIEEVRDTDAEGGAVNNPEAGELRAKMENETVKPVKEEEKVEELMKDEDDPEMAGLCEYEKIRLRNIRRREALFAELDLKEAKHEAREASGVKKEAVSTRRGGTEEGLRARVVASGHPSLVSPSPLPCPPRLSLVGTGPDGTQTRL